MKEKDLLLGVDGQISRGDFIHDTGLACLGLALPIGTVAAADVERTYSFC
ncbi:MAG: hypothetical protein GY732_02955 [Gammaproteobacteria bacterium]|nr:hypothetical protein [Gammaproteobacteria bacterium]